MINYYRFWDKMNRMGKKPKELREIVSPATVNKLHKNQTITTETINKLCSWLNCQPGDILEFEPDEE
ncbi:helix-turn-helix domain-containing protein [bacterium]|nr:helix-turn-helix domain-containing protein [bacterium]